VPTLLVRGSRSDLVPEESVRHFLDVIPDARYVDVQDAGHMVVGDRNDAFRAALIEFLEARRETR
jgi:pimeloyl-ACP methyl ester carboxylesterase